MNTIKTVQVIVAASLAPILAGCFEQKMPEVNNINCQPENIKNIEDQAMQKEFAAKCLRRPNRSAGQYKPSPKREW